MTHYWIVSSKHSRDESTKDWDSKWTTTAFLKSLRFFPSRRKEEFQKGDHCILKVFGAQELVADFEIASSAEKDKERDTFFVMEKLNEWDFPVDAQTLPDKYTDLLSRSPSTNIDKETYHELIGIRNFTQDLRLNYKKRLTLQLSERDVEDLLDSMKDPLRSEGLRIIERQAELRRGNRIDLICKDRHGDLVVIELKKKGADATVGQLARYVTHVRERKARPGQKVRGLILAFDIDEQLVRAARGADFDVMLYQVAFE
jgi:hypothetical protein